MDTKRVARRAALTNESSEPRRAPVAMAKKKKPAPEPEAAPEAADEAPDYGPALAEAAREAVEEGIEAAFARAEQNELDKLAPAFVAADLMRQLNIAVAWATLEPDRPTAALSLIHI